MTTAGIYPQAKLTNSIGVAMEEILEDPRLMEKHQNLSIVVIDMEGINMQEKSANYDSSLQKLQLKSALCLM